MSNHFLDNIAASSDMAAIAKAATAGGSVGAVIFGIDAHTIGVIGGLIIGLTGLIYTVWATERTEKRRSQQKKDN
jgi:small neutral amino acid transporter SnatA (MarC family)